MTETAAVVMVKFLVVVPAATVTLAGTVVAAMLSESVTIVPPEGAGALSVTVPVAVWQPPMTVAGLTTSETRPGGAAACVTVKVLPATVIVPVREAVAVFAATL